MGTSEKVEDIQKDDIKDAVNKNKSKMLIKILFTIIIISLAFQIYLFVAAKLDQSKSLDNTGGHNYFPNSGGAVALKPVIYLYPTVTTDVNVKLEYKGELIVDYPSYDDSIQGWNVVAEPDGRLVNIADDREYSYIFWEGIPDEKIDWDLSKGFVVKGEDTIDFLQEKLPELGLTPIEYNEFIVYWYPLMKDNTYNLIHFAGEQYTDGAPLEITPTPDSMLRVFMVYKPLEEYIDIDEQTIEPFERKGFSVIEWGGSRVE